MALGSLELETKLQVCSRTKQIDVFCGRTVWLVMSHLTRKLFWPRRWFKVDNQEGAVIGPIRSADVTSRSTSSQIWEFCPAILKSLQLPFRRLLYCLVGSALRNIFYLPSHTSQCERINRWTHIDMIKEIPWARVLLAKSTSESISIISAHKLLRSFS